MGCTWLPWPSRRAGTHPWGNASRSGWRASVAAGTSRNPALTSERSRSSWKRRWSRWSPTSASFPDAQFGTTQKPSLENFGEDRGLGGFAGTRGRKGGRLGGSGKVWDGRRGKGRGATQTRGKRRKRRSGLGSRLGRGETICLDAAPTWVVIGAKLEAILNAATSFGSGIRFCTAFANCAARRIARPSCNSVLRGRRGGVARLAGFLAAQVLDAGSTAKSACRRLGPQAGAIGLAQEDAPTPSQTAHSQYPVCYVNEHGATNAGTPCDTQPRSLTTGPRSLSRSLPDLPGA